MFVVEIKLRAYTCSYDPHDGSWSSAMSIVWLAGIPEKESSSMRRSPTSPSRTHCSPYITRGRCEHHLSALEASYDRDLQTSSASPHDCLVERHRRVLRLSPPGTSVLHMVLASLLACPRCRRWLTTSPLSCLASFPAHENPAHVWSNSTRPTLFVRHDSP